MNRLLRAIAALCVFTLAGCGMIANMTKNVEVAQPMTAKPAAQPVLPPQASVGAIYKPTNFHPLFEDPRARNVGDTITIVLNEQLNAAKQSASSAQKTDADSISAPTIHGVPFKTLQGLNIVGNSSNKFAGQGASSSSNNFTGTITVTVIDVLGNGNLIVSGERQIGINQGSEFVRFSGVVNPTMIVNGNTVSSTQVADARIEYRGNGYIDEAQTMGWLSRFFMTVAPF
jgi:flagellar L-ring protein precursor FlgH